MISRNLSDNQTWNNTAVILGNFDGIHRGHQLLLARAKELAAASGLQTAALTFLPHPAKLLSQKDFRLIYTEAEKERLFAHLGLEHYILFPFTEENRNMLPQEFLEEILIKRLGAKAVVVGSDYRFGRRAAGNSAFLLEKLEAAGVKVEVLEKLKAQGEDISSTRLRSAVLAGDLQQFEELTGRSFHVLGRVSHGRQLGRTIGFPTVNILPPEEKLLPPNGVYVSQVLWQDKCYFAVSNLGVSPSIENKPYSIEAHILDFEEMIYGEELEIRFLAYLRPEITFASLEDLKLQIQNDVAAARLYLK